MLGSATASALVVSVSPVTACASLDTLPMSPAARLGTDSWCLPMGTYTWPMRSVSPVRLSTTSLFAETEPLTTRKNDSFPTNGSAVVLKMNAASGPPASAASSTSAPPLVARWAGA